MIAYYTGFPGEVSDKEPACQCSRCWRHGFDPWVRKIPGGGHGNPLQYSCLENPMDRGGQWATVHTVAKSWKPLKWLSIHARSILHTQFWTFINKTEDFAGSPVVKTLPSNAGRLGLIPGWGSRIPHALGFGQNFFVNIYINKTIYLRDRLISFHKKLPHFLIAAYYSITQLLSHIPWRWTFRLFQSFYSRLQK